MLDRLFCAHRGGPDYNSPVRILLVHWNECVVSGSMRLNGVISALVGHSLVLTLSVNALFFHFLEFMHHEEASFGFGGSGRFVGRLWQEGRTRSSARSACTCCCTCGTASSPSSSS